MAKLYYSKIYHKRELPTVNKFQYRGLYLTFDIEKLDSLKNKIFSVNKFNLFSFYEKDHGNRDGTNLKKWVQQILVQSNVGVLNGPVILQTIPRMFGYVFNPVSFYHCYHNGKVRAVICEVNNTFNENHNYVVNCFDGKTTELKKEFHVSPFFTVDGKYKFEFRKDYASINYFISGDKYFSACMNGYEVAFSEKSLLLTFFKFPFFTIFVVFLIHYQALKLFIRKNKFYTKPEQNKRKITYEYKNSNN